MVGTGSGRRGAAVFEMDDELKHRALRGFPAFSALKKNPYSSFGVSFWFLVRSEFRGSFNRSGRRGVAVFAEGYELKHRAHSGFTAFSALKKDPNTNLWQAPGSWVAQGFAACFTGRHLQNG